MIDQLKSIQLIERLLLVTVLAATAVAISNDPIAYLRDARDEVRQIIQFRAALREAVPQLDWTPAKVAADEWFRAANERSWEYPGPMLSTGRQVKFNLRTFNGFQAAYVLPFVSSRRTLEELLHSVPLGELVVPERRQFTQFVETLLPKGARCKPCLINMGWLSSTPLSVVEVVGGSRAISVGDLDPHSPDFREEWALEGGISIGADPNRCTVDSLKGCAAFVRRRFSGSQTIPADGLKFPEMLRQLAEHLKQLPAIHVVRSEYGKFTPDEVLPILESRIAQGGRQLALFGISINEQWAAVVVPMVFLALLLHFIVSVRHMTTPDLAVSKDVLAATPSPMLMRGMLAVILELFTLVLLPVASAVALWFRLRGNMTPAFVAAGGLLDAIVVIAAAAGFVCAIGLRRRVFAPFPE